MSTPRSLILRAGIPRYALYANSERLFSSHSVFPPGATLILGNAALYTYNGSEVEAIEVRFFRMPSNDGEVSKHQKPEFKAFVLTRNLEAARKPTHD